MSTDCNVVSRETLGGRCGILVLTRVQAAARTVQPASHSRVERQVQRLDQHLAIFQIILRERGVRLHGEGLAGDDLVLGTLGEDDRLVGGGRHY